MSEITIGLCSTCVHAGRVNEDWKFYYCTIHQHRKSLDADGCPKWAQG